jgi:hypothetical protein
LLKINLYHHNYHHHKKLIQIQQIHNLSAQLQIPTEPPQGDATPLGGLGQQQPSPQQNQN